MTALPMKQAMAKLQLGSEAGNSPQAKASFEKVEQFYVVAVSGIPQRGAPNDALKQAFLKSTSMTVKGKEPIAPVDVQFSTGAGAANGRGAPASLVVFLVFAKTTPFTAEDKEIDFVSKYSTFNIKTKFHPKDMVVNGKLEM